MQKKGEMLTAITGGAGFIGSHFVENLILRGSRVLVIDNFSSGKRSYLEPFNLNSKLLEVKELDVSNTKELIKSLEGVDRVIHLASNPDIAKAALDPRIDFLSGTCLTESVIEAARICEIPEIIYASGSGVYGDAGQKILFENSPLVPISTYGASKLAGESLLSSYPYMFGIKTTVFRFANVVGPRQTHGITFDLVSKIRKDSSRLDILGNGNQYKSYLHVSDVVQGVLNLSETSQKKFDLYNLANTDNISVSEIAFLVLELFGINPESIELNFGTTDRGWKADIPIVNMNSDYARSRGWNSMFNSKESIIKSIESRIKETENQDFF
jgi:UDP-glucose 4-epimerase